MVLVPIPKHIPYGIYPTERREKEERKKKESDGLCVAYCVARVDSLVEKPNKSKSVGKRPG